MYKIPEQFIPSLSKLLKNLISGSDYSSYGILRIQHKRAFASPLAFREKPHHQTTLKTKRFHTFWKLVTSLTQHTRPVNLPPSSLTLDQPDSFSVAPLRMYVILFSAAPKVSLDQFRLKSVIVEAPYSKRTDYLANDAVKDIPTNELSHHSCPQDNPTPGH